MYRKKEALIFVHLSAIKVFDILGRNLLQLSFNATALAL